MTKKEQMIENYMKKLDISREEAEQLFEDDSHDFIGEDGEKMTKAAKATQHREQGEKKTERKPKTRKVDADKKYIFDILKNFITGMELHDTVSDVTSKTETEINFVYNNASYTCKLTKHKTPKA